MSAPYTYIAQDIKDTHDLYERVINSGRMLDEDEIISKRKDRQVIQSDNGN